MENMCIRNNNKWTPTFLSISHPAMQDDDASLRVCWLVLSAAICCPPKEHPHQDIMNAFRIVPVAGPQCDIPLCQLFTVAGSNKFVLASKGTIKSMAVPFEKERARSLFSSIRFHHIARPHHHRFSCAFHSRKQYWIYSQLGYTKRLFTHTLQ